jgi:hypothetical protein
MSGVPWRIKAGSGLDDRIYLPLLCTLSLNDNQYSAIADLHTSRFTAAHALRFSVSICRILAMDLNTEIITPNHYKVLSFLLHSSWNADPPELHTILWLYLSSLVYCIPIPLVLDSVFLCPPPCYRLPLQRRCADHVENTRIVVLPSNEL